MNFDRSDDQRMLVDNLSNLLRKESPLARARALRDDALGWDKRMWHRLGELGYLGLFAPESAGGSASDFATVALAIEELGAMLVPEPFIDSAVVATSVFAQAGTSAQCERFLTPIVSGRESLALAWAESAGRFACDQIETTATRKGDGYVISGEKVMVPNGHAAEQILVTAKAPGGDGGISIFVVGKGEPGVRITPIKRMDGQRAAHIRFDNTYVRTDSQIGAEGAGYATLSYALDCGAAAACAEAVGIMRKVLAETIEYLKAREQFGVKIGSFQVLQHRAADMFIETELAQSASLMAALHMGASQTERANAVSAAYVQVFESGRFVTQQSIQLHGGIAITDEHDAGMYFKRMQTLSTLYGDADHHVARYAV